MDNVNSIGRDGGRDFLAGALTALKAFANPQALAPAMRKKRAELIASMISDICKERGRCRILDLGGRPEYWDLFERRFLQDHGVSITLVNMVKAPVSSDRMFTEVQGDACSVDFPDNSFDLIHSNSVIEHVGPFERIEAFAREVRRLAPRYYIQTPYYWFPIEPHFTAPLFQYRSERARVRWIQKHFPGAGEFGAARRLVESVRLLDKTQMRYLFPDAELRDEKFFGLTKSLMAVR